MTVAGTSYVVLWWLLRGRLNTLGRSLELRVYLGILVGCTVAVMAFTDDLSLTDSAFTAVSAVTTTGFAVTDWTALHGAVLMVLLVFLATGPMSASAGGGLRVVRAWTLVRLTARELRRQLDPNSVVVVKQRGVAIDERTLDETAGYQIAHLGLCSIAAFTLAACGFDLMAAIYTGISVVSSFGPGIGPGAFGHLGDVSAVGRLALLPFMLAGRLTILPLLLALATVFTAQEHGLRRLRRVVRGWRR
jgi:trk system potassium uptake protein TrkH